MIVYENFAKFWKIFENFLKNVWKIFEKFLKIFELWQERAEKLKNAEQLVTKFWSQEVTTVHQIENLDEDIRKLRPTHQNAPIIANLGSKIDAVELTILDLASLSSKLGEHVDNQEAVKARVGKNCSFYSYFF